MTDALWITSSYPWTGNNVAGVFFGTQARALARLGLAVTVAAPTPVVPWPMARLRAKWREYDAAPRRDDDRGVAVVRPRFLNVPGQPSWSAPDRRMADATWRSRATWHDARLIHGHYAVQGLAAWRLSDRTGRPFFITFHGDDMTVWPGEHPERLADLRTAAREAAAIIAVSQALADVASEVTGVQAVHLPLGIDLEGFASLAPSRAEARRMLALPDDRFIALMVSYLIPYKGARLLADAVLGLRDPFFGLFVGEGPDLEYGCDRPEARNLLEYRGRQPHELVPAYLAAADVVLLPSEREGLPTILVEAGSLGTPVIASGAGGIPDLLADGRGTVLPELSAGAVAEALRDVARDGAAARASAERLRAHVQAEYDVDRNAERLLACYRRAVPQLGGPSASEAPTPTSVVAPS